MKKEQDSNSSARKTEINRLMDIFEEEFKLKTSSTDDFITIHEIERMWGELQQNTLNIFSDMIRDFIGKVDERDMIRKKNENIPKEG
jgi:hypothetical protein